MDAQDWNKVYADADERAAVGQDERFLAIAAEVPTGAALDLGCGCGALAITLARLGWEVTAIDFSERAIQRARAAAARADTSVDFQVADLATWRPQGRFDLVVSSFAMPPAGAVRDRVFETAADALGQGGRLVCDAPEKMVKMPSGVK